MSAAVTSMSVIASHCRTTQAGSVLVDEVAHLLAERPRVREEQRRLPPVDHDARELFGLGVGLDAVPTLHVGDAAQDGTMRPPAAPEEEQDGQHDGQHDPLEHAEEDHPARGDQREREGAAPDLQVATQHLQVHQRQGRGDHHGGQGRLGKIGQQPVEEEQQDDDHPRPDEAGHLALGPRLLSHRRARAAGGHREPLEEGGGDVRRPHADHLLVRLDLIPPPCGEGRGRGDGVGEGDHGDADRRHEQWPDVAGRGPGQLRRGDAGGEDADGGDTLVAQAEEGRHDRGADDADQYGRHLGREPWETEEDDEDSHPHREGGGVGLVEALEEGPDVLEEVVAVGREAEELGQLADHDRDGQAVHVADLDLAGEQVGHEAELAQPQAHLDQAHHEGEHPRQGDGAAGVVGDQQRGDRRQDQRRHRRVRAQHQHP